MIQSIRLSALLFLLTLLGGCLTPVKNEMPLVRNGLSAKATGPNETKVIIFNSSNWLLFPLTGRINVKLNEKEIANLNIGQYAEVVMPRGGCQVDLVHWDVANFYSQHIVELKGPESFLEVRATPTANQARIVPELPRNFEKRFKPVR